MFRLIRWAFSLLLFFIVLWFATTVPIGRHTLWQHLRRIGGTKEAQELAEDTKVEAKKIAGRLHEKEHPDLGGAPLEKLGEQDRKGLDHLVREKTKKK